MGEKRWNRDVYSWFDCRGGAPIGPDPGHDNAARLARGRR